MRSRTHDPAELAARAGEWFAAHGAYVERVLRGLGVAEADLPDARQDVFVVVHRRLPSFEGRSRPRTWLHGICLRVGARYRRRVRRRRERSLERLPESVAEASQHRALALKQSAEVVEAALARLSEAQRRTFVMYELEQRPMQEVSAALGCPEKTGFSRLYAARRAVNAALRRALVLLATLALGRRATASAARAGAPPAPVPAAAPLLAGAAVLCAVLAPQAPPGAALAAEDVAHPPTRASSYRVLGTSLGAATSSEPTAAAHASLPPRTPHARPSAARFRVEPIELPGASLVSVRIGLSEVIPVYALNGQPPPTPPAVPHPVETRLSPELLRPDAVLAAIHGSAP